MTVRPNLAGLPIAPFQFPPLRGGSDGVAAPPGQSASAGNGDAPADLSQPAGEENGEERAAAVAAERAAGRRDGFESGFAAGRQEGYAAGFAQGSEAGEAAVAAAANQLAAIVAALGASLSSLEPPVHEAVAALALEVARCVVGSEVKRSRDFLARLIREALAKVPLQMATPRILLNPGDLDIVRRLAPAIVEEGAVLVADEAIEPGGCIVVADADGAAIKDRRWNPRKPEGEAQVDLTLASRWREVMLALFDGEDE